jgi:hypothetical protein
MTSQELVAGAALIAFGIFLVAYGLGWAQCNAWRDQLDLETEETGRRTQLFHAMSGRVSARDRTA